MEHLSNDHEDRPNQQENSHKLCDETGHPVANLMKSQWKLRQKHDQTFPMEGKPLQNKYQRQKKHINLEGQDCERITVLDPSSIFEIEKL